MNTHLLYARENLDADTVREICLRLFPYFAGVYTRAWPDVDEWLETVVPERFGPNDSDIQHVFTLRSAVQTKLLAPELNQIYSVESPDAFARLVLAAFRHSELAGQFFPSDLDRRKVEQLCRQADFYEFRKQLPDVSWFLGVGIAANEVDSLLVASGSKQMMEDMLVILLEDRGCGPFILWPGREAG